jgi:hypothetical protein
MMRKTWMAYILATLCVLAISLDIRAREEKPADEGKGAEFEGRAYEMKEKGEVAILLSFVAGKDFTATTKGDKETDVHLFVYDADGKEVGKDTSPGPKCEVKVTPKKSGKYKLLVRNVGPGANKVTLAVKVSK